MELIKQDSLLENKKLKSLSLESLWLINQYFSLKKKKKRKDLNT